MALLSTSLPAHLTSPAEDGNKTNCSLESVNQSFTYVPAYILSISILGIVFNIFVLMVFILHKKSYNKAEIYLIYLSNLAAADLLLVSFLPFWAVSVWNKFEWIFGLAMCKMVNVSILMNVYCSIYFLVLISIDRYVGLVRTLSHEKMRRPKFAKISCVVVWILGLLLSVPKFINRKLVDDRNKTYCHEADPTILKTTELMVLVLGFFIPISIILFCTVSILKVLRNRSTPGENPKKKEKKDHKADGLVLAVLLVFLICWVPFHLREFPTWLHNAGILTGCRYQEIQHFCGQFFTYLAFFNSVLNPILYVIVGKKFRRKVEELFRPLNRKQSSTSTQRSSRSKLSILKS